MNNETPIDLYLITGFLGSGKTTLVNNLLQSSLGKGSGLLVNDFGDVVVDSKLIHSEKNLEMFEIAGGSIFCSCKTESLGAALKEFADLRPEKLIIEASGISDPSGMDKILIDYRLASEFNIAKIITLADAVRTPKLIEIIPSVQKQIMAADLIILNKCDLVSEEEKNQAISKLKEYNDEAEIIPTINAKIDIDKLTRNNKSAHRRGTLASCNLPGNRPSSTLLTSEKELPKAALDAFLHDQLPNTWRIKGWIKSDGKWWYISDNAGRLEWNEETIPDNMTAGLTVITPPGVTEKVEKDWDIFKEKFIA